MATDADEMARSVGHDDQRGVLGAEVVRGTAVVVDCHAAQGEGIVLVGAHVPYARHHLQRAFPLGGVTFDAEGAHPHIIGCPGDEVGEGVFGRCETRGVGHQRHGIIGADADLPPRAFLLAVPAHCRCRGGKGGKCHTRHFRAGRCQVYQDIVYKGSPLSPCAEAGDALDDNIISCSIEHNIVPMPVVAEDDEGVHGLEGAVDIGVGHDTHHHTGRVIHVIDILRVLGPERELQSVER